jgi:hypothetical protein
MANRVFPVILQLIITYVIIAFIVKAIRKARRQSDQGSPQPSPGTPTGSQSAPRAKPESSGPAHAAAGRFRREERLFNGVVWQIVYRPHRDLSEGSASRAAGDDAYVEEPPRCPKCGLGVIETHSWLGYKWACPECGARARSPHSIEETARMLAHRH